MKTKILWTLVVALAVVQVADFFLAPTTIASVVKRNLGTAIVMEQVANTFQQKGEAEVRKLCSAPLQKFGFYYTCTIINGSESGPDGNFSVVDGSVLAFTDRNAATLASAGLMVTKVEKLTGQFGITDTKVVYLNTEPDNFTIRQIQKVRSY